MHSIIMIRTVFFILALSLSLFKLAHADQKIDLYSTPVNAAAQANCDLPTWEAYDFGEDALEQLNLPE